MNRVVEQMLQRVPLDIERFIPDPHPLAIV